MSGLELVLESVTSNTIRSVFALIGKRGGDGGNLDYYCKVHGV